MENRKENESLFGIRNFFKGIHVWATIFFVYLSIAMTGYILVRSVGQIGYKPILYIGGSVIGILVMYILICLTGFVWNKFNSWRQK